MPMNIGISLHKQTNILQGGLLSMGYADIHRHDS